MTPGAATRVIEQAVETAWGTTTTVAWPNVPFTPDPAASWLKVDFIWGNGALSTKDRLNRTTGVLQLAIFTPKGAGDGVGLSLAETARAIFNRERLVAPNQDIMFGATSGPVARFEESWRSFVLSTPFQVDEVVP